MTTNQNISKRCKYGKTTFLSKYGIFWITFFLKLLEKLGLSTSRILYFLEIKDLPFISFRCKGRFKLYGCHASLAMGISQSLYPPSPHSWTSNMVIFFHVFNYILFLVLIWNWLKLFCTCNPNWTNFRVKCLHFLNELKATFLLCSRYLPFYISFVNSCFSALWHW